MPAGGESSRQFLQGITRIVAYIVGSPTPFGNKNFGNNPGPVRPFTSGKQLRWGLSSRPRSL